MTVRESRPVAAVESTPISCEFGSSDVAIEPDEAKCKLLIC